MDINNIYVHFMCDGKKNLTESCKQVDTKLIFPPFQIMCRSFV
jgi:hypothetical protein